MPFYAYKDENDQADMLLPRAGWTCAISRSAPLVYESGKIVDRTEFDSERQKLLVQAPTLKAYADRLVVSVAGIVGKLSSAERRGGTEGDSTCRYRGAT